MNSWYRVAFSTKQSKDSPGELRRLETDVRAPDEAAADAWALLHFPDAFKILSRPVNRAERRRVKFKRL